MNSDCKVSLRIALALIAAISWTCLVVKADTNRITTKAASAAPTIAISRQASDARLTFGGILQSAPTPSGQWTDHANEISPLVQTNEGTVRYFRTRRPEPIFASNSIIALVITGAFQTHFEMAHAGMPDGIFPPARPKPYFDGSLNIAGTVIPVTVKVRGNSSLQECPFPKLKFKVNSQNRKDTPFEGAREVKIGTHCAEGGEGSIGRLRDERAAYREVLAYETMSLLEFAGPRVRRARIHYHDTSSTNASSETGWTVTRSAMIMDDPEVVGERLGGRALDDEELGELRDANFNPQLITDLQMLHILFGNWDFALSTNGVGLWNTDVIELPGGGYIPVAGDFDLCSWVTGNVLDSAPHDYRPGQPPLIRRMFWELEQLSASSTGDRFGVAGNRFMQKREAIQAMVAASIVDDEGRANAAQHLSVFYEALFTILLR